jgi:hypothetical protein
MPRKPRVVSDVAVKLAEMIDQAVEARVGPNSTFEERQDVAAAVAAEVLAELRKSGAPGPKAGS